MTTVTYEFDLTGRNETECDQQAEALHIITDKFSHKQLLGLAQYVEKNPGKVAMYLGMIGLGK